MLREDEIQIMLYAMNQYCDANFIGERRQYAKAFIAELDLQINAESFRKIIQEVEEKFSNRTLWDVYRNVAMNQNWPLKKHLRWVHNHTIDMDLLYTYMNDLMHKELPKACFDNFVVNYLQPKAETYVKVIAPEAEAAREKLEEAKDESKRALEREEAFFKGAY